MFVDYVSVYKVLISGKENEKKKDYLLQDRI